MGDLGRAIEVEVARQAKERMAEAGSHNLPGSPSPGKVPGLARGSTRDIVGRAVGVSGPAAPGNRMEVDEKD